MASIVIPAAADLLFLDLMLKKTSSFEDLTLALYKNNVTPLTTSVAGDFTVATFTGYSSVTLTRGTWDAAAIIGDVATSVYAPQTFTCSGGSSQVIYGATVVGSTSGSLYWAWKFDIPRTISSGNAITITPTFTAA